MAKEAPEVFISYARKDGQVFAENLVQKLGDEKLGDLRVRVWRDKESMRGGDAWWDQIEATLNQVEYLILVLTKGSIESRIVKEELDCARKIGVCIYPVIHTLDMNDKNIPFWISKTHCYKLKHEWTKLLNDLNTSCKIPRVPNMVENLPDNIIKRKAIYDNFISTLLNEKRSIPKAITASLKGAGGFGKTIMAQLICHDEQIKEIFYDGIIWVTLGEDPGDITSKLQGIIDVLCGHWPKYPTFIDTKSASNYLNNLLKTRAVLLVVDDVWDEHHLTPFLVGGKECCCLVTTRNRDTLPLKSIEINVDEMEIQEAKEVLTNGLPKNSFNTAFEKLAKRLGEWPLLLNLVNRILLDRYKLGQGVEDALKYVNLKLDKQGLLAFDRRNAKERNQAAQITINVSLELLTPDETDRFKELAVFPEDVNIPLETVGKLWAKTADYDTLATEDMCKTLYDYSLIQVLDLSKRVIRLHDIIRKYLREQTGIDNIHRLDNVLIESHKCDDFTKLHKEEPYLWRYLADHMTGARRIEELKTLLSRYEWIKAKLEATDILSLLRDYSTLAAYKEEINLEPIPMVYYRILQMAAPILATNPDELSAQFLGRIMGYKGTDVSGFISDVRKLLPGNCLEPLTPSLKPVDGRLRQVLRTQSGIVSRVMALNDTDGANLALVIFEGGRIVTWNHETGEIIREKYWPATYIEGVAFRHKPYAALGVEYNEYRYGNKPSKIILYNAITGETLFEKKIGRGKVSDLAISADDKMLCTVHSAGYIGSKGIKIFLWELPHLKNISSFSVNESNRSYHTRIEFSPGQHGIYIASKLIELRESDGEVVNRYNTNKKEVEALAVSERGNLIACVTYGGRLLVFKSDETDPFFEMDVASDIMASIKFLSEKKLLCADWDGNLFIVDITKNLKKLVSESASKIFSMDIYNKGTNAITGHKSLLARTWNLEAKEAAKPHGHEKYVSGLVQIDHDRVASSSRDGKVSVWRISTGERVADIIQKESAEELLAIGYTNDEIVAVSERFLFKIKKNELEDNMFEQYWAAIQTHPLKTKKFDPIIVNSDETIVWGSEKSISRWNYVKEKKQKYNLGEKFSEGPFVSADGGLALVQFDYGRKGYALIDLNTHNIKNIMHKGLSKKGKGWPFQMAMDSHNQLLAIGYFDGIVEVRKLNNGRLIKRFQEDHSDSVMVLSFSGNSNMLFTASSDGGLKVWDIDKGICTHSYHCDTSWTTCSYSDEHKIIIAGDADGGLHFLKVHIS